MTILIRTDDVPAADRIDLIQGITATTWVPMEFRTEHVADVWAEFRASGLGAMQVVVMDTVPFAVRRTPALISQADPDMLKLLMVCDGSSATVEQNRQHAALSPAEFAFYDTRRPFDVVCGVEDRPGRVMTFMFPPSLLPMSRSQIRDLTATRVPATAGLGDLASQFLLQLARHIDHYSPAEAARLSTAAVEVLATRLAHELDAHDWATPETRKHALLTTIQAFICQRLGDPELSPTAIAAAHHMSLRSLQQLFRDEGLTVAGWIRWRRLEGGRRDLSNPALFSRPVAAIAAKWGFSSASDFSRVFRATHGMPPGEYRESARVVNRPAP